MQVADEHASSRRTRLSYLHPANNTNKQYANPYKYLSKTGKLTIFSNTSHLSFDAFRVFTFWTQATPMDGNSGSAPVSLMLLVCAYFVARNTVRVPARCIHTTPRLFSHQRVGCTK